MAFLLPALCPLLEEEYPVVPSKSKQMEGPHSVLPLGGNPLCFTQTPTTASLQTVDGGCTRQVVCFEGLGEEEAKRSRGSGGLKWFGFDTSRGAARFLVEAISYNEGTEVQVQ